MSLTEEKEKQIEKKEFKPNNSNRNLIIKFRRNFTYPMCLAIIINLAVTIYILISISNKLSSNKALTTIINDLENDRNRPIIENVGNIIYKKFQPAIFSLISFKKYINHLMGDDFLKIKMKHSEFLQEKEKMRNFLNKYSNYIPELKDYEKFKEKTRDNYLDQILWFLDTKIKNIDAFIFFCYCCKSK